MKSIILTVLLLISFSINANEKQEDTLLSAFIQMQIDELQIEIDVLQGTIDALNKRKQSIKAE